MTIPQAIVLGATLIGASIIGSRLIAPYEIAGAQSMVWRVNSVTGDLCWDAQGLPGDVMLRGRCR